MATEKDFQDVLENDKIVYQNIVKGEVFFTSFWKNITDFYDEGVRTVFKTETELKSYYNKYYPATKKWSDLVVRYRDRQEEIRNRLKNATPSGTTAFKEWDDKVGRVYTGIRDWMRTKLGLGIAPIVIPVAQLAYVGIAAAVLTYIVSQFTKESQADRIESIKILSDLAQSNPALNTALEQAIKDEISGKGDKGLFDRLSDAAGHILTFGGIALGVWAGVKAWKYYQTELKPLRKRKTT